MILGCKNDEILIGKDETMKDYLPELIIDIIRSGDLETMIELHSDISKASIYGALKRGKINLDDMMDLCVESVNCVRKITQALKGAGYEV